MTNSAELDNQDGRKRISQPTQALIHHIEQSWLQRDAEQRSQQALTSSVRSYLEPKIAAVSDSEGRQAATHLLTTVSNELESLETATEPSVHLSLPAHLATSLCSVIPTLRSELTAISNDFRQTNSADPSRLSEQPLVGTSEDQDGQGSRKRSMSPLGSSLVDEQQATWFETAAACSFEHSVPRASKTLEADPARALDILADPESNGQGPMREFVVLTAGHHRASDVRELF